MEFRYHFITEETQRIVNKKFGLPYIDQDWEIVNSSAELVDDFVNYYNEVEGEGLLCAVFDLVIASLDEVSDPTRRTLIIESIETNVKTNLEFHLSTIIYWSQIGTGEVDLFRISKEMRILLSKVYRGYDEFRIVEPDLYGIYLNDESLLKILVPEKLNFNFDEILEKLATSGRIELSDHNRFEIEYYIEYVHLIIYGKESHYYRLRKDKMISELKRNVA